MKQYLKSSLWIVGVLGTVTLLAFQNCGQPFQATSLEKITALSLGNTVKYEIFIASDKDVISSDRAQTISLSVDPAHSQEISAYYCSLNDGAAKLCAANYALSDLNERIHKLTVQGKNSAGVVIATGRYDFVVDLTAPSLLFTQSPGPMVGLNTVTFAFSSSDLLSRVEQVECSLDNGPFQVTESPHEIKDLSEALHSFKCRATDSAKNVSILLEKSWTNSLSVPGVALAGALPAFTAASNQVSFTTSSATNLTVSTTCALDAANAAPCVSGQAYTGLAAGIHSVKVTAKDTFNRESSVVYSWTVDLTPPAVVVTTDLGKYTSLTSIPVAFRIDDGMGSGAGTCECGAGQDPGAIQYGVCQSPYSLSGTTEGLKGAFIRCRDAVGNLSAPSKFEVTVDRTPPVLAYTTTAIGLSANTTASFTFTVAEAVSNPARVQTKLDQAAAFTDAPLNLNLTALGDGTHTLQMRAVDEAGNVSAVQSYSWIVDISPPEAPKEIVLAKINSSEKVTWNASVDAGGIASYEVKLGSTPGAEDLVPTTKVSATDFSVPYQYTFVQNGQGYSYPLEERIVYVSVRATDRLGNVGAWGSSGPTNPLLRDSLFPYRVFCSSGSVCRAAARLLTTDSNLSNGKIETEDYLFVNDGNAKLQVLSHVHNYQLSKLTAKSPGTLSSRCKIQGNTFPCDVVTGDVIPGLGGFVEGTPNRIEIEILYNGESFFKTATWVELAPSIFLKYPTPPATKFTETSSLFYKDIRADDIFSPILNAWAEGPVSLRIPYICWRNENGTEARVVVRDRATAFLDGSLNAFQYCNTKVYADSSSRLFFTSAQIDELSVAPGAKVYVTTAFSGTRIKKLTKLETAIPPIASCPYSPTGACPAGTTTYR